MFLPNSEMEYIIVGIPSTFVVDTFRDVTVNRFKKKKNLGPFAAYINRNTQSGLFHPTSHS